VHSCDNGVFRKQFDDLSCIFLCSLHSYGESLHPPQQQEAVKRGEGGVLQEGEFLGEVLFFDCGGVRVSREELCGRVEDHVHAEG